MDYNRLDTERDSNFIITRAATRGTLSDWFAIKAHYGLEAIKNRLIKVRDMDDVNLQFFSVYFDLPKEAFRCYTNPLWNREP